ncbi:MAG: acyl-ACP--UDP-N-acetylglucosamine O-acyltransferase, partial [Thermodesulfobacteriota bacterium]|nr:acyl-ACP--UDP-N-acetylglucosamine O-acyltransferase [Thermodesulfobacteriota bacterium]
DTEIGPYTIIGAKVRIGKGVKIGAHVNIEGPTSIDEGNKIFPYVSIGTPPQDLKYEGGDTQIIIGKNNTIREFVTINRGTEHGGRKTIVGDNNFIMAYVHIAHDCQIGNTVIMSNVATLGGHIEIEDYAVVGGITAVHQFVRIGAYSFIGGASALSMDLPPYLSAAGNRAKIYGVNVMGLERNNFTKEAIENIKSAYRIIFRSRLTLKDAMSKVEDELAGASEVARLVEFIKVSKRGICR